MAARPHLIRVQVVEARGLSGKDSSSVSDVLCSVSVGPTSRIRRSTVTRYGTNNAVWNETFLLEDVQLSDDQFAAEKIALSVFDRNDFSRNELIGMYEFSLGDVYRQKGHEYYYKWVPLTVPQNPAREYGYLLCSLYVLKEGDPTPNHDDRNTDMEADVEVLSDVGLVKRVPYFLNVLVYKASGIVFRGSLNPFVSVRFNGNHIQTKVMSNISNPIWNRKFEMPFHLPLESDSIEVQVWNRLRARPDKLIGAATFSYFQLRLTHRPFGPKWINLYSATHAPDQTSFMGTLLDSLSGAAKTTSQSEYVGRMLLRLSVSPVPRGHNPRLTQMPCNPTTEPEGEEYAVHFVCYSGSEIPVMGGKVRVELAFGTSRISTRWVMGRNGVFKWNQVLDPIFLYCPKDLEQVHDFIINVYHKSGAASRKICFERVPAAALLPDRSTYWCNGREPVANEYAQWKPEWRSMEHVYLDPKRPHVIAGFLLCSIGFGLRKAAPSRARIVKPKPFLHTLKVKVYHACNLPAGDENGSADPFLVVRYHDQSAQLDPDPVDGGTLFPFFYDEADLDVNIDENQAPSVYIMLFHRSGMSHTLLGRAEVLTEDILELDGAVRRFPLFTEDHPPMSEEELRRAEADGRRIPYVLASLELFPYDADRKAPPREPEQQKYFDWLPRETDFEDFCVKVEAIGLRNIVPFALGAVKSPELQVDVRAPEMANMPAEEPFKLSLEPPVSGHVSVLEPIMLQKVRLPLNDLHGVPLRIRLVNHGAMGEQLVGSCEVPVANFIHDHIERPPFYIYHKADDESESDLEDGSEAGSALDSEYDDDDDDDDDDDEAKKDGDDDDGGNDSDPDRARRLSNRESSRSRPTAQNHDEEEDDDEAKATSAGDEGDEDGAAAKKQDVDVERLELDPDPFDLNSQIVHGDQKQGKGKRNLNNLRKIELRKELVGDELETRPEFADDTELYTELKLRRGAAAGLGSYRGVVFNDDDAGRIVAATLKAFVRVAPAEQSSRLLNDDLLRPLARIYRPEYMVRLYIYRGINLTPKEKFARRQTANAYLQIKNGPTPEHQFSDRHNYHEDDLNPNFYQVVELPAKLPGHSELEIEVWDHDVSMLDEIIGATTIDLEWRLLHNLVRGEGNLEYRRLRKPGTDISQGRVLMRCDILTIDEARRVKAEDLRPPQPEDYELRMVMWKTRGVRFPEDKDAHKAVDQKMLVTTNFTGQYGKETTKTTDVAWDSSGGAAEWNYRMVWPVQLPCKLPRVKIAVWDEEITFGDNAIGEVLYNLQPLFNKALREKQAITHQREKWIKFSHPDFRGASIGEVCVEFWLVTAVHAEANPVGEAQDEPNQEPFLAKPRRNAAFSALTSGFDAFQRRRMLLLALFLCAVVLPIAAPFMLSNLSGSVF